MTSSVIHDVPKWQRVNALLQRGLALPVAERETWLGQIADQQADLMPLLRALFARATAESDAFMARPADSVWALLPEHAGLREDHRRRQRLGRDRHSGHPECHRGGARPVSGVVDVGARIPRKLTLLQRLYYPEIARGLRVTIGHLLRNLANWRRLPTIQYPEQRRNYSNRFRGRHILKTREDGTFKCVACYMCQQACPAECITIVAGEHPKVAYEKYPVVFDIDMLRCVFCGFCVDACPKDAIWMTRDHEMAFFTRQDAVFSIDRLREKPEDVATAGYGYRPYYPGDGTTPPTDAARMPVVPGSGERDRLRAAGVPLPDRVLGPGPLNAPSTANRAINPSRP